MEIRNTLARDEQSVHLPEEIIEEIFSRVAVKSVLRFRCVSKSCYSLTGSKRFIKKHLQNSTKNTSLSHHMILLLYNSPVQNMIPKTSLLSLLDDKPDYNDLEINIPTDARWFDDLLGCCNGLICVMYKKEFGSKQFILWNPTTKISKALPDMDNPPLPPKVMTYGFGWDERSDDYKVVVIFGDEQTKTIAKLYSLKSNSWKNLDFHIPLLSQLHGVLASGKLHWVIDSSSLDGWDMVCLDLQREVFDMVEQPSHCLKEGCSSVPFAGLIGECLSLLFYDFDIRRVDIWVMKEYGVKESWEKLVILDYRNYRPIWISSSVAPFCTGDILLIKTARMIISYVKYGDNWSKAFHKSPVDVYVESLVSPLD